MLTTYTVTNLNDAPLSGPDSQTGTLRWAIAQANVAADADVVEFASGLTGDIELSIIGDIDPGIGASALEVHTPITVRGNGNPIDITRAATATERRLFRVAAAGDLTLEMLTLRGGTARGNPGSPGQDGTAGLGGAIYNQGTTRIYSNTLYDNSAIGGNAGAGGSGGAGFGGAIYNDAGNVFIRNSTLSGNSVAGGSGAPNGSAFGGSIYGRNGSLTIHNSTLTLGAAVSGRDVYVLGIGTGQTAVVEIQSSIIARDNVALALDLNVADDLGGQVIVSGANNLIRRHDVDLSMIITSDDPNLGALINNGGPTLTHALLDGSPAIGLGSNLLNLPADQRGGTFVRVAGLAPDIGAFEVQVAGQSLPGDYNGSNIVDAGDFVIWRKTLGNTVEQFAGADGNGNQSIDMQDYHIWRGNFGAGPAATAAMFISAGMSDADSVSPSLTARTVNTAAISILDKHAELTTKSERVLESAQIRSSIRAAAYDDALLAVLAERLAVRSSIDDAEPNNGTSSDTSRSNDCDESASLDAPLTQSPHQTASHVAASIYKA
jgi:hypothetical protein